MDIFRTIPFAISRLCCYFLPFLSESRTLVRHNTVSKTGGTLWRLFCDFSKDTCMHLKPHFQLLNL
ncbi:unnamed protein product [Brugia timori]|uniref:Secreted protein n=1 Tax=Brugia timori TaxID=42155 RepID=A0A0R3QAN9_9BILA|nr:unnamed protein product [Brugia timori]